MSGTGRICSKCGQPIPEGAGFCPACGAPVSGQAMSQGQAPLSGFDSLLKDSKAQSHWLRRFVGFIIDAIIAGVVAAILGVFIFAPAIIFGGPAAFFLFFAGAYSFLSGIILVLYFAFAEALWGGTVGRRAMGLKVVTIGGATPTVAQTMLRNASKIYWLLLLLDIVVGLAMSKKYDQKYSDTVAGTEVIEVTRVF